MHIIINHSSMVPIYEQIVEAIKEAILSNQLSPNEALPSVRALSKELKISALTVKKAYDFLEKEGYTEEEIEKIQEIDGKVVSLGPRILRTETASVVASSIVLYELSDLGGNI